MIRRITLLFAILIAAGDFAQGQQTGTPPFGSLENSGFDTINRQNLNGTFAIPIVSSPGRGVDLNLALVYNSLIWTRAGAACAFASRAVYE